MSAMTEAHIELKDVRKAFGSKVVLNGVDLDVRAASRWW